ncbi:MAG: 2'-5' RNA ligase family protein [Acidimicrobiales bacterium]
MTSSDDERPAHRRVDRGATYLVAVPLPDAATLVAPWRHTNRLGAHVTLLSPFTTAPLDSDTRQRFARRLRREPRFCVTLDALGWFDERVVYARPDQGPRWEALARVAARALGRDAASATTTPHVTVAKGLARDELEEVAARTSAQLPWTATARSAVLYEQDRATGRWHPLVRAAFAAPPTHR